MDSESPSPRQSAQYQRLFHKATQDNEDARTLSLRYERFVRDLVEQNDGIVSPMPEVPTSDLVNRSVNRIKPFNRGDKGFRDTLIWLGVIDLVRQFERVSFVSENTSDFANKERGLHPDLDKEVATVLPEHTLFRYFSTLDEFIALVDKDGAASAQAFQRAVMSGDFRGFNLYQWLENNLIELAEECALDEVQWAGIPYWAEDPRLLEIEEIVGIDVGDERIIEGSQVEFFCDVVIIGEFQCSIAYHSWEGIVYTKQVQWVDEESNNFWTEIGIRAVGTFTLRLVFDLDKVSIISALLVPLHQNFDAARDYIRIFLEDDAEESK